MGRPRGQAITEEHRQAIIQGQTERWRHIKEFWPIREAVEAGDERKAIRLLRELIRERREAA